ncbi:MAG: serine hydroxymethyltransferase [Omnitrophica WOR_2 bacterium GWF2_43_52]|nr:MAG: serine hydroxymethyltransferase [Omnitrophica WOR_2 bacterium GWF2_43_52]HAH20242.1 serine hydroxymethyltransferase [Candidatus Omnitrophota bacterium]HBG63354.1 serine hydroxymethyltransferase [Candidatus Omnitrophota bacterium]
MKHLKKIDPQIYNVIHNEAKRQEENLELIASENFTSPAVLEAMGSILTNKYAEGYPHHRWYGGCENVDVAESLAIERATELFKAEHVNVQAHSGSQANMAVYFSCLNVGDTIMALDLACGGHLTHGHPHNFSGKFFKVVSYGVHRETEKLDYDQILTLAKEYRPRLILAGASAYPRIIDFKKFRGICDSVGAYLFVDMAHIAGLVAAGAHPSPVPYAEFVSSTTHKTLRGPRGGFVICKKEFSRKLDLEIFPGIQGGPLMHVVAAKAVAFKEAMSAKFKKDQRQTIQNARVLCEALKEKGYRVISGGTDNHLFLLDVSEKGLTGKEAQEKLDKAGITVNKNLIPFDDKSPVLTSGIRIGTPAVTTRGMKEKQMKLIAEYIDTVLKAAEEKAFLETKKKVRALTKEFPLYAQLKK